MSDETIEAADIREILKLLPHRYPFVMIDRIVDIKGEDHGIGIKNITFNEPQFLGHFPDNPVMPGVLLIEGMAQTAGVLCLRQMDEATRKNANLLFSHHRQGQIPQTRRAGRHRRISRQQDRASPQHVVVSRGGQSRRCAHRRGRSWRGHYRGINWRA